MAYTIKLTPAVLIQKANNIDTNAATVQREVDAITELVHRLRPTFLGETASTFFKEYDSALNNMKTWDDIVRSFSVEIRDAANKLNAADQRHH